MRGQMVALGALCLWISAPGANCGGKEMAKDKVAASHMKLDVPDPDGQGFGPSSHAYTFRGLPDNEYIHSRATTTEFRPAGESLEVPIKHSPKLSLDRFQLCPGTTLELLQIQVVKSGSFN